MLSATPPRRAESAVVAPTVPVAPAAKVLPPQAAPAEVRQIRPQTVSAAPAGPTVEAPPLPASSPPAAPTIAPPAAPAAARGEPAVAKVVVEPQRAVSGGRPQPKTVPPRSAMPPPITPTGAAGYRGNVTRLTEKQPQASPSALPVARRTAGGRRRARFGPACGGGRSAAACVRRPRALGPTACPGSPSAVRQNAGRAGDSPCGGPCVRRRAGFDRTACCGFPSAARQNADCAGGARSGQSRSAGAGVEPRAWRCCPSGGRKNFCARCRGADDREGRASTRGRAGNVIRPTAAHAGPRSAGIDCRPSADRIA